MTRSVFIAALSFLLLASRCTKATDTSRNGAYQFADRRLVAVTASAKGALRIRRFDDGWSALLRPANGSFSVSKGFSEGDSGERAVFGNGGLTLHGATATRVPLPEVPASFQGRDGKLLSGKLILPRGTGPWPAIVLVHGSGKQSAVDTYHNGYFFAAHGIATLVYDKRGTGRSEGTFTANFETLSDDVAAAVRWLQHRSDIDGKRIGLSGYSQGGWVAPLAATKAAVAFVIVNFGIIDSPAYEETTETLARLRERGLDEQSLLEARELVEAATHVLTKEFRGGWKEFDAVAKKYRGRAWMKRLDETTAGAFLRYPHWVARMFGMRYSLPGLSWNYDSRATLRRVQVPVVWILGGKDVSAPNERTQIEIRKLIGEGRPHELILFPDADHNILRFELRDGKRTVVGYEPEYFRTEVSAARRLTAR